MISRDDVFKIGHIGKPHGVKGELRFHFDDDVFDRADADYLFLDIDGILVPFFIEEYRFHGSETALMKFEGIDTIDQAEQIVPTDVYFPRQLTPTDEAPSWAQIMGFQIVNDETGEHVGTLQGVDDSTANVLFEVMTDDGRDLLLPANEDLITDVDTEEKIIRIILPQGIADL